MNVGVSVDVLSRVRDKLSTLLGLMLSLHLSRYLSLSTNADVRDYTEALHWMEGNEE